LGNPGKITALDMSYADEGRQVFLNIKMDALIWDREAHAITNNMESPGLDQNLWTSKLDKMSVVREWMNSILDSQTLPFFEPIFIFFPAAKSSV
jgi:hypothetical protein